MGNSLLLVLIFAVLVGILGGVIQIDITTTSILAVLREIAKGPK